jgi:peptidoglycan/xylan/chitin deacetylase (PgdA/CDA1 family)
MLTRGAFTLSLDFELIWGTLDLFGPDGFRRACEIEREEIVDRLLEVLVEFEIPATWCIVGHLFLDRCDGKHPEIAIDQQWFAHDPGTDQTRDPIFYGCDLIEKIRACKVPQEIGSHSFSHVIFGDCSRETAASELAASLAVAGARGVELRSFVFPRNVVGHVDLLRDFGFLCYRGPEPVWYENGRWPGSVKRIAHLAHVAFAMTPPVVTPIDEGSGLWNIPGSMIYFPMHGVRRYIPLSRRVRRAVKGLDAAARHRRVFHLWFHPTNLVDEMESMFRGLREICAHARALRDQGKLDFSSMSALIG